MRGVHRGRSTVHRVAKRINPLKMILFGASLLVLCNVCPWSFLESRINRSWKEISSLDDAMSFAKRYTGRAQVNTFDALRKMTQKYIGLDIYFIVFNILRLTIAMALKDLICLAFPVTQPKKKSLGRKLIHTMRSQVHPDADESDEEPVFEPIQPDRQDLGPIGGATQMVTKNIFNLIFSFFRAVLRKMRMYVLFVWYLVLMVVLFGKMLFTIPKAILVGLSSGVEQSGILSAVKRTVMKSGVRKVMWDNLAELFEDSDTDDSDDEDQPELTGRPLGNESYMDDTETEDDDVDPKVQENIEAGLIDSTQSLNNQLNRDSVTEPQPLGPNGDNSVTTPQRQRHRPATRTLSRDLADLYDDDN